METKNNPWMPLYVGDYLKDTAELTLAEHGAYLRLILFYWNNGGAITSDLSKIYRATGAISQDEQKNIASILNVYFEQKDGSFFHKRIDKELEKTAKIKEVRSKAGRKGGRLSGKSRRSKNEANDKANDKQTSEQNRTISQPPSPSPLSSESKITPLSPPRGVERFDAFWDLYPSKVGKKPCQEVWRKRGLDKVASEIMAGLALWVESAKWQKDGGQFIPNPLTFLNQERWRDTPEVKVVSQSEKELGF